MPNYRRPDFTKVKGTPIEDVLDFLGIDTVKRGKQLRSHCIICNHPSKRAFTVSPDLNRWHCFGFCRAGGDTIQLVASVKQITNYEAACLLARVFNTS